MAELPQVLDPESGWLQNANDPPWYTTFPLTLDPDDYPDYMAPEGMAFRPQRSARMLFEDESVTFEELMAYKHSTRMEMADRLLDDLIPLARESGNSLARKAVDVLEAWDRAADADSRGTVLFVAWARELARVSGGVGAMFARGWSEESPRTTPDGLAEPEAAVAALETAAEQVLDEYGALDVPFGEVHRVVRDDVDLPANGHSDPLGVFRAAGYRAGDDGRRVVGGGDSFVFALEFSSPLRAEAVLGYGNASQPGSPHRTDQLELFSTKRMRPVWRARSEIEEHLKGRTRFPSRVPPAEDEVQQIARR
jgi:acyl-homoserine-lactone acylase